MAAYCIVITDLCVWLCMYICQWTSVLQSDKAKNMLAVSFQDPSEKGMTITRSLDVNT